MAGHGELERRVALLEQELAVLKQSLDRAGAKPSWIDRFSGVFKDDPDFDEIVRLGREYRQAQDHDVHE
jgi:hypothetical protein